MVVVVNTGVLNVVPVIKTVPPESKSNQLMLSEEVAVSTTEPLPQLLPAVTTGEAGNWLMVATTGIRLLEHVPSFDST